jgi:pimeloyl-ACP methyl ester carboxylesterase
MTESTAQLLVLHELGDPTGGSPWPTALAAAGWAGAVVAPDLPGHAGAPPPIGGHYDLADGAFAAAALDLAWPADAVVGIGASGWAAMLVALGGRARSLVLVDGLGAPWHSREAHLDLVCQRLRALERLSPSTPPPAEGLDPALAHPPVRHGSERLAREALRQLEVPVLVVEPRHDGVAADAVRELAQGRAAPTTVSLVDQLRCDTVAASVARWLVSTEPGT